MGHYLTDPQIETIQEQLTLLYSLPYAIDLLGTVWEQILADAKGGTWINIRDNRPRPDFTIGAGTDAINYSVKTEGLRTTLTQTRAQAFLGLTEDLIVARPKVDELFEQGQTLLAFTADQLGALVLQYYNERIVQQYHWHVLSILLRVGDTEFIYWEEQPVPQYNPADYWWVDSERATGSNRNISGYPLTVPRPAAAAAPQPEPLLGLDPAALPVVAPAQLPSAKFKWTSGGKQFYIRYLIPQNADILQIQRIDLTVEEVKEALHRKLAEKAAQAGIIPPT